MNVSADHGERQHETCRWGTLNPGFMIGRRPDHEAPMTETPILVPVCNWRIPEPAPPAAQRGWGGAVEYDRDCAVCTAHQPVDVEEGAQSD